METISYNNEYVQDIKSMLKEKLGINYALPKYSFDQECKVHFMVVTESICDYLQFDKEDIKDHTKNRSFYNHMFNSSNNR